MALSLLCGGLGVAEAAVRVNDDTSGAYEVLTKQEVTDELDKKVSTEVADLKYAKTSDVYTRTDANEKFATKTELGSYAKSTDVYSKTDADDKFATNDALNDLKDTVNGKADKSYVDTEVGEVDGKLANKADKATTLVGYGITDAYTREKTDELLNTKANAADVYTRGDIDTKLADVYSKTEVDGKITDEENARNIAIQNAINGEAENRKNAIDVAIAKEVADRNQAIKIEVDKEANARDTAIANAKNDLQTKITEEKTAREALDTRLTKAKDKITANETAIDNLKTKDTENVKYDNATVKDQITLGGAGGTKITNLKDADLSDSSSDAVTGKQLNKTNKDLKTEAQTRQEMDTLLSNRADALEKNTGGITRNDAKNETYIEKNVTVDNQGSITAKGKVTANGGVDAGAGAITTTGAVNAGSLNVTDASYLKGDVTMDNKLSVTGDTSLGKTDVGGALNVTGASNLQDNVILGMNAANTVTVNGKSDFKAAVEMENGLTVDNGLTVKNGDTKLKDTTVTGNLNVTGTITTDTMIFGDKPTNYTEIDKGHITSKNAALAGDATQQSSSMEFDRTKLEVGVADKDSNGHLTMTADKTTIKNSDLLEKNYSEIVADKDSVRTTVKDEKNNTTSTKSSATEIRNYAGDAAGNKTINVQTATQNKSWAKDKDGNESSIVQTGKDITNTAEKGTITSKAKDIVNDASGNISNNSQTMYTTVTGKATESYGSLDTTVNGNETHIVKGTKTETVDGKVMENYKAGQATNVTGNQDIHVTKNQTNKIDGDQVNIIGGSQTTTATDINRNASSSMVDKVDNAYGTNTETKVAGKTTTDVSIKGTGEKGKYIRGANESRDYLIKGTLKNSETKTVDATSTEITDGKGKTSATIQDKTQISGSVTNGTSSAVSNVKADSIDTAVKEGTNTSLISQKKDSITSAVGNGTTSTVIQQGDKDITIASNGGTVGIVGKDIINNATNEITNTAGTKITDKVGNNTRVIDQTSITDTVGTASRKIEDGKITDTAGDSTVTTENGKGTTFAKVGSAAYSTEAGATKDTNIAGNHITTGRVDANELGVSDKDDQGNTADLSVKAGEGIKSSATDKDGNTTYTKVTATENSFQVQDKDGKNKNHQVNTKGSSVTEITDKDGNTTKTEQTATDITNEASNSITDKVGTNTRVLNKDGITDTVGGSTFKQRIDAIMMESKNVSIKAEETLTNEAKVITNKASEVINNEAVNINNTATGIITSKASKIKNQADKLISNKVGENTWENMENGKITTSIKDGTKQNLTQSDAAGTTQSTVDGGKSTVTIQNADGLADAVTDGTNTSVQNQTASAIAAAVKDGAGNENASVANATTSVNTIKSGSKANTVISTADGTSFINSEAAAPVGDGTEVKTTIKGNTITTGKVTMDYAEVMKDLGVRGNANITGKTTTGSLEVTGTSTLKGDVTMGSNATVKKDLTVEGNTNLKNTKVDGTLDVTQKATFGDSVSIAKDLSVDGNATIKGDVTAKSYKVGDKTYISAAGINANDQKITNVADGSISEGSKDAVNGGQLYGVKNDLEGKVNKVGANAAAMANLHPMEFDPDSKWNIAAAIGNYGSETAAALGAFYRPNDDVMVNLSTAFGTGENMVGGGVSVRLGKSGNKLSREESNALKDQVNDLTARMDALLSVLNPNMSKDFPDVPENHWAYEAVSRLAGNDILQGYPDGEFHGERTMTRYEMAEIIYNALSRGAEAEKELVEEFKPELQAMAASEKATAERAEG